jgi:carboxymethylenebutenolidase
MRVTLQSGTPAEVAVPAGPAARGVVVFPDIQGLRPLFDDLAARLADEQAWAVAEVELFPNLAAGASVDDRFAAVPTLDDGRILGDASAAADLLVERAGVDRVAVMGFCIGGMYAYKAAASSRFDLAVSFYGMIRLPPAWRGSAQREPLVALGDPHVSPVLSIVGGLDPYTPSEDVAQLGRFGPLVRVVAFPEADHGFVHDPSRPAHRPGDAAAAWAAVAEFLA